MTETNDTTTEAIVEDIKAVAARLGRETLSRTEYVLHGTYSHYDLYDGGRTWGDLCSAAGVRTRGIEPIPDEVYFERLQHAVASLGRHPKTSERKKFGLNFSKSRWPTLNSFVEAAVECGIIQQPVAVTSRERGHATSRHEEGHLPQQNQQAQASLRPRKARTRPVPPIPAHTRRRRWRRIDGVEGFPYAPHDELGVVALFAVLCSQGHIPWQILDWNHTKGIDATCYDEEHRQELRVELKYILRRSSWNHPIEQLDYVVCWENSWPDFPKRVVELSKLIEEHLRNGYSGQ